MSMHAMAADAPVWSMKINIEAMQIAYGKCIGGFKSKLGDWFHGIFFGSFLHKTPVGNKSNIRIFLE